MDARATPLLPLLWLLMAGATRSCGPGHWRCHDSDTPCIDLHNFCDGIEHCDDGSDEPLGCTNCNRTFSGEASVKYPLRVTGPFRRYLPFLCRITFVAGGEELGDFVELTFLSFQVGRLQMTRNQTTVCERGYLRVSEGVEAGERPSFGQFCGAMSEQSVTFFSRGSSVSIEVQVPSSASFGLYLTYRFLPTAPLRSALYLGEGVPGTYCDRLFSDCHRSRKCRIRTPNFPGFYSRNISCSSLVRHLQAPQGYKAKIVLGQPNDYKISVPASRSSSTGVLLSRECEGGDSVTVFDGPTPAAPKLLEFCGSGPLPEVVSSGPEVLVVVRSAAHHRLTSARVEVEVEVRFERLPEELWEEPGRCSFEVRGDRRRWGLLHSPRHTMPSDANCTYRLIGASEHDRVWVYFTSFFVHVEETDAGCAVSGLEMLFCGEYVPRLCAHAADYPPTYLPPRPCEVPGESYLSSGPELVVRHRFLSSFTARYEFVDTGQQGSAVDRSECDRLLDSRLGKSGRVHSPRNVFLFGRGGRENVSCTHHFVGLPWERLRLTVRRARLPSKGPCPQSLSKLSAVEFWEGHSAALGCVSGSLLEPVVFDSFASNVQLRFEVAGMSHLDDFDDYFFEADYEFVDSSPCESGLQRASGGGVLRFRHSPTVPSVRCRWQIEAPPHKHLYLQFEGVDASGIEECGCRLQVSWDPGSSPSVDACVDSSRKESRLFGLFSRPWYNASETRDLLFLQMVASASCDARWLSVTRPSLATPSGRTLPNPDCSLECPEIGACIEAELACDGTEHCPSGIDEAPKQCATFSLLCTAAAGALVCLALLMAFAVRRRRMPSQSLCTG